MELFSEAMTVMTVLTTVMMTYVEDSSPPYLQMICFKTPGECQKLQILPNYNAFFLTHINL
jgi:hypothetical protein